MTLPKPRLYDNRRDIDSIKRLYKSRIDGLVCDGPPIPNTILVGEWNTMDDMEIYTDSNIKKHLLEDRDLFNSIFESTINYTLYSAGLIKSTLGVDFGFENGEIITVDDVITRMIDYYETISTEEFFESLKMSGDGVHVYNMRYIW